MRGVIVVEPFASQYCFLIFKLSLMLTISSLTRRLAVATILLLPGVAFAQTTPNTSVVLGIFQSAKNTINNILIIVFALALLVFGWGVVKYISSAGNPEKEKEARRFLWWGVIGVFVLASVFGLVNFIGTYFGVGQDRAKIKIPSVQ